MHRRRVQCAASPNPSTGSELIQTIAASVMRRPSRAVTGEGGIVSRFADDPDVSRILEGFVTRLANQIDADAPRADRPPLLRTATMRHRLKGAGGCYGYPMLTDACKLLEDAAAAIDFAAAERALDAVAALSRAIRDGYNRTGPAESVEYEHSHRP